ncbi:hypothetical protein PUR61_16380 [Streptomyces sp. BE20]|uniref:hypothetical protein n=1 Tax=Streptomyces sp. BE20 TaxID=3002525 RepID=UPI002E7855DB|nr:hypothetical protein [Streptomyces sp. BE20]MEE1823755.1 hypothetical protein [Streptomyces sp. BE20]
MTSTAPVTAACAPPAVLLPPAPLLGGPDLAVLRFALLPGTIADRLRRTGMTLEDAAGAADRACCLVGASTLAQAGALTALHRLLTAEQIGLAAPVPANLTTRRRQALTLMVGGLSTNRIAGRLGIHEASAIGLCREVARALGVNTAAHAGYAAVTTGAVPLSAIRPHLPALPLPTVLTHTDPRSPVVSTSPLALSVPATRPPEAAATVGTARAEVLLTDDRGRVLITAGPRPGDAELPGGPLLPHETPPAAAERHAKAATALAHLTPGRLLAIDWRPGTGATYTYDHPPLTGVQAAALTADDGRRGAPRLLAPAELLTRAPADAQRVLTTLRARVEGRTAELEHGRPRTPGVLDTHRILPRTVTTPAPWTPADYRYDGPATSVAGWLFLPSGLVVLHHDPVTGRSRLPGGPLAPGDADALDHALARTCATAVGVRPRDGVLIGHSGTEARLVATVSRLGPLIAGPCEPAVVRLLATPEQAVDLCENSITAAEVRDALESAAIATGLVRQPVTLVPATGMTW